jgi:hypothetical protein
MFSDTPLLYSASFFGETKFGCRQLQKGLGVKNEKRRSYQKS